MGKPYFPPANGSRGRSRFSLSNARKAVRVSASQDKSAALPAVLLVLNHQDSSRSFVRFVNGEEAATPSHCGVADFFDMFASISAGPSPPPSPSETQPRRDIHLYLHNSVRLERNEKKGWILFFVTYRTLQRMIDRHTRATTAQNNTGKEDSL